MRFVRRTRRGAAVVPAAAVIAVAAVVVVATLLVAGHRSRAAAPPIAERRAARVVEALVPHGEARFVGSDDDLLMIDAPRRSLVSLGGSERGPREPYGAGTEADAGAINRLAFRAQMAAEGAADVDPRIVAYSVATVDWTPPGDDLASPERVARATAGRAALTLSAVRRRARSDLAHLTRAMPAGSLVSARVAVLVVDAARRRYGLEYDLRVSRFPAVRVVFGGGGGGIERHLYAGLVPPSIVGVAQELVDGHGRRAGAFVTDGLGESFGNPSLSIPGAPSGDFFGQ